MVCTVILLMLVRLSFSTLVFLVIFSQTFCPFSQNPLVLHRAVVRDPIRWVQVITRSQNRWVQVITISQNRWGHLRLSQKSMGAIAPIAPL